MEFNVAQLLKGPIGARREYELEEDIAGLDADLIPLTPLTGTLHLLRIHSGILATGDFRVTLEMECSRCLEPIPIPLEVHFEESFRPLTDVGTGRFLLPDEFEGDEEELADAALLIDEQHILSISEVLRQNIWLALPLAPGCIYPNPQSCPHFRLRLQELEEVHQDLEPTPAEVQGIDPRWAALLALHPEHEDEA